VSPSDVKDLIAISVVSVVALGTIVPLARALAKRIAAPKNRFLAPAPADSERMERMERAIEAISIEVERIAESQRFMTRLLAEGEKPPALP
jgi:hypothetical protein